jgi:hypothetical protein
VIGIIIVEYISKLPLNIVITVLTINRSKFINQKYRYNSAK